MMIFLWRLFVLLDLAVISLLLAKIESSLHALATVAR